jgi:hypothetical protein
MDMNKELLRRQLMMGGGMMYPDMRQGYGLGSFVRKITKPIKKIVKSDIGKAALLGAVAFGIPGTSMGGLLGRASFGGAAPGMFGFGGIGNALSLGKTKAANFLLGSPGNPAAPSRTGGLLSKLNPFGKGSGGLGSIFGIGALGAGLGALMAPQEEDESDTDYAARKAKVDPYLRRYYTQANPDASPDQVDAFVEANTKEYKAGGRVGYKLGTPKPMIQDDEEKDYRSKALSAMYFGGGRKNFQEGTENPMIVPMEMPAEMRMERELMQKQMEKERRMNLLQQVIAGKDSFEPETYNRIKEDLMKKIGKTPSIKLKKQPEGILSITGEDDEGPAGVMYSDEEGNPITKEQAMELFNRQAMEENKNRNKKKTKEMMSIFTENKADGGLMGLKMGGVPMELDYRANGGFVPIGKKEKADDVPARLSKNEFVMTADAVRGMGNGSVQKGAQRLYDQMKQAEKMGRGVNV